MSGFDIFQQVLSLSMKICSVSPDTGTAEQLQTQLGSNLAALFQNSTFTGSSSWKTVWGPVVWQAPFSDVADQAIAVSLGTGTSNTVPTYVVSIAATNPNSSYDVFFEDAAVAPNYMVAIPGVSGGKMSVGNWTALQVLLSLTSGGQTLAAFLASVASTGADVVFAGHSLGGGLTPLLAYSLYPTGTKNSGWANVHTYATAGPATANSDFATAFDAVYGATGSGYQMWNANQYNTRDIVPNAWSNSDTAPSLQKITAGIVNLPGYMYFTNTAIMTDVVALRNMAQMLAGAASNTYTAVNNNALFTGARQYHPITSTSDLEKEVLYQHIQAYIDQYQIGALFDESVNATIQPPLLNLVRGLGMVETPAESALEPA